MLAALPMYAPPEVQFANDALWRGLADRLAAVGIPAPATLTRPDDLFELWLDPALFLAQTCGYPLVTRLLPSVQVVATPVYAAPGCDGPTHRSVIIVHRDSKVRTLADLRGGACAFNAPDSNSGMNLLRHAVAAVADGAPFFGTMVETGSHAGSLEAVSTGRADVAATDCVTYALLKRWRPEQVAATRILTETAAVPCLPLITAASTPMETITAIRDALNDVVADPALAEARAALFLERFEVLPGDAYQAVQRLEDAAITAGYPVLA